MKITKPILKQIIKESLEDEQKEKMAELFKNPDHRQQAIEISKVLGMPDFLVGANLYGANLRKADLRGFDLRHANLTGVYLTGADLSGADLSGAELKGAFLRNANFSGTNLKGVNSLSRAYYPETTRYDKSTIWPKGFDPQTHKTKIQGDYAGNITVWLDPAKK
jgi:hypothetical protein